MTTIRNATLGALLTLVILGAYGLVDRLERDQEDRLQYRAWIADACTPGTGETVIARNQNGKLHCTIYSHVGYGIAPIVVSAAVMELPL
jgi:hypothetical protein